MKIIVFLFANRGTHDFLEMLFNDLAIKLVENLFTLVIEYLAVLFDSVQRAQYVHIVYKGHEFYQKV